MLGWRGVEKWGRVALVWVGMWLDDNGMAMVIIEFGVGLVGEP
jgi:hypothetical protein